MFLGNLTCEYVGGGEKRRCRRCLCSAALDWWKRERCFLDLMSFKMLEKMLIVTVASCITLSPTNSLNLSTKSVKVVGTGLGERSSSSISGKGV